MGMTKKILCRDINGGVHIVSREDLVMRTSVYALIRNTEGVLLVRDRTRTDKTWDLPGGGVEPGEELSDALRREVKEETGIGIVNEPQEICEFTEYFFDVDSQKGWESTRHFYTVRIQSDKSEARDGNNDDIVEVRYIAIPSQTERIAPVAQEIVMVAD